MKIIDGIYFENNPTITTNSDGDIVIIDDILYPINGMNKEDCVSIYIVLKNSEKPKIIFYLVGEAGQSFTISTTDGFISFCHIVLPTQEYYNTHLDLFNYYWDGENPVNSNGEIVTILLLIEINDSKLIRHIHNFFYAFHLRNCFIALCLKIFKERGFNRCLNTNIDSLLIYKRDLVWAALNVIQYMVDFDLLAEAQRILERINGCNGLCAEVSNNKDCGCE